MSHSQASENVPEVSLIYIELHVNFFTVIINNLAWEIKVKNWFYNTHTEHNCSIMGSYRTPQ